MRNSARHLADSACRGFVRGVVSSAHGDGVWGDGLARRSEHLANDAAGLLLGGADVRVSVAGVIGRLLEAECAERRLNVRVGLNNEDLQKQRGGGRQECEPAHPGAAPSRPIRHSAPRRHGRVIV
jgi:hypothetical protein